MSREVIWHLGVGIGPSSTQWPPYTWCKMVLLSLMKLQPSTTSIRTVRSDLTREKSEGKSRVGLPSGTGTIKLNPVLHAPTVAHNSVSISGLCDEGHTMTFTKDNCIVKKTNEIIDITKRTGEMYAVGLKKSNCDKALLASEQRKELLDSRHARLSHADRQLIKWMATSGAVNDLEIKRPPTS